LIQAETCHALSGIRAMTHETCLNQDWTNIFVKLNWGCVRRRGKSGEIGKAD
jgi:hypothetical protein